MQIGFAEVLPIPRRNRGLRLAKEHAVEVGVSDGVRTRDLCIHSAALYLPSSTHHEMVMDVALREGLGMELRQHWNYPREGNMDCL